MLRQALTGLLFLPPLLLLGGCAMDTNRFRIGVMVLVPYVLLIGVLWLLNRRGHGEEEDWNNGRFPDSDDDDDNEDHFLM